MAKTKKVYPKDSLFPRNLVIEEKTPKTGSVSKLLRGKNVASDAKAKSDVPALDRLKGLADDVYDLSQKRDDAEAAFRAKESELLAEAGDDYAELAESGAFSKSLNYDGDKTPGVQVTYQDRFSDIPVEAEAELKAATGPDYDKLFQEKRTISLEKTDDKTIQLLVDKLGEAVFGEIFKIKVTIAPKPGMDEKQFNLNGGAKEYVKQYKAAVKVRK